MGQEFGLAVLTLDEALQTFVIESQLFRLQLKVELGEQQTESKFIRLRKEKVIIEGNERTIVMIRDVTDSFQNQDRKLKHQEGCKLNKNTTEKFDQVYLL